MQDYMKPLLKKMKKVNLIRFDQVRAVVFETTGDVPVLLDKEPGRYLDFGLIENVRGANLLKNKDDKGENYEEFAKQ